MSPYPDLISLAQEQNRILRQVLGTLTGMSLDMEQVSLNSVPLSGRYEILKDAYQNRFGTQAWEHLLSVLTVTSLDMRGPQATIATTRKKPTRDLHGLGNSPAPLPATSSTVSTRKRAKPARTGGKSKAPYHSDGLTVTERKRQRRRIRLAKRLAAKNLLLK